MTYIATSYEANFLVLTAFVVVSSLLVRQVVSGAKLVLPSAFDGCVAGFAIFAPRVGVVALVASERGSS